MEAEVSGLRPSAFKQAQRKGALRGVEEKTAASAGALLFLSILSYCSRKPGTASAMADPILADARPANASTTFS